MNMRNVVLSLRGQMSERRRETPKFTPGGANANFTLEALVIEQLTGTVDSQNKLFFSTHVPRPEALVITLLWATGWHLQAGFIWRPPEDLRIGDPFRRHILLKPSQRAVLRITAPADSITVNGTLWFEEIAKAPKS